MKNSVQGSHPLPLTVAVVGAGPSGFYAIQSLFKEDALAVKVDLFDRMPTPFGLVRSGVAPDHQKIKNVVRIYEGIASDGRFRFFGNVELGRNLPLSVLREHYDAIIFATGNESDRRLGIAGESLQGIHSATEFVGWYNGHPDYQDRQFSLEDVGRVIVIGNGNVAVDVARILAKAPGTLAETDITELAQRSLNKSRVSEICMVARRGPCQAAFSPKELKELSHSEGCYVSVDADEVALDAHSEEWLEESGSKDARKNVALLRAATDSSPLEAGKRAVRCMFLASPVEFVEKDGRLGSVIFERNEIWKDDHGNLRPRPTGQRFTIEAQMVLKAIGYRGEPIPGVPFHKEWGIIPNEAGRVLDEPAGRHVSGLYVVGWAKRGPTGLIGSNSRDSQLTVAALVEDLTSEALKPVERSDIGDITEYLGDEGVNYVTWQDWELLDADEKARGQACGKLREKYTSVDDMLAALDRLRP